MKLDLIICILFEHLTRNTLRPFACPQLLTRNACSNTTNVIRSLILWQISLHYIVCGSYGVVVIILTNLLLPVVLCKWSFVHDSISTGVLETFSIRPNGFEIHWVSAHRTRIVINLFMSGDNLLSAVTTD